MSSTADDFVQGMLRAEIYPHPCTCVRLLETHISWVFLTGLRAYKIKKPVHFDFVDFSTLERRRDFCFEELRLNRRLAPDLYLDVVSITGSAACPQINGDGPVIDYAVCMMQFDQRHLLNNLVPGMLQQRHIDELADHCARFHNGAAVASGKSDFGSVDSVGAAIAANFESLRQTDTGLADSISSLQQLTRTQLCRLDSIIRDRRSLGMIRECHGDLHLGNMFLQDDRITIFDGIEFNDDLRWIDIISDIAFLIMDLEDRHYHGFGNRFLNRWLEQTGDYDGLAVLRFYCGYRAMVRAKIDAIRVHQQTVSDSDRRRLAEDCRGYLNMARRYAQPLSSGLTITYGPSGSGKTTVAGHLIDHGDTIRIRSDVERKRLFGLELAQPSDDSLKSRMYSRESSLAVYGQLANLAEIVVTAGFPVVIDAAFLRKADRDRFRRLADRLDVSFRIIKCTASPAELQERVEARQRRGQDASEADVRVLARQLREYDDLAPDEQQVAVDAETVTGSTADL